MSVMNVLRKGLPTATLPVVAGLAAVGLAIAPAAQAVRTAPVRAASTGLHVTGKVDRFSLSSPAVHRVSVNNAYPADMAADSAGLYYEGIAGTGGYLFRALGSGSLRRHADVDIDAPLALAAGNVYLLAIHDNQAGNTYLDAFRGSTLGPVFSKRVSNSDTDIAGTGIGLLLLGAGKVSLLDTGNGQASSVLSVPGAVILVPGPSAAVVTLSHSTTYLLRLAG